ncbi:MAG: hypothetical protein JWN53_326 [Gemmatimonadetes bacterium]|nr:hypothetical protein [Gemmatimonadota bacterium]
MNESGDLPRSGQRTAARVSAEMDAAAEVTRRLAEYARTSDPGALWPGLTERARVAAAHEIERVTRARLGGASGMEIDPHNSLDPYALSIAGFTTGMGPLLGRWAEDGSLTGRAELLRPLADALDHGRRRAARIERELLPALDALIARDIGPVVLKGLHTSRVYFEEPGVRRMADVDLLVAADRIADAEDALSAVGFRPRGAASRPYKRDWIGPTVDEREFSLELAHERSRWTIELHASLDRVLHPGAVARLDAERSRLDSIEIAGRTVVVLAPPLLVLVLACHCSQELDSSRLLRLVEIVRVVRVELARGRLHWDDVLALSSRTGTARYAYPALALAEALAPGTIDPRVLTVGRGESTWAARHTVDRLVPAGGSLDDRGLLRQLMWTRGPVAIAQRVLRTIWPASFTRPRDVIPGWRARLRRWRSGVLRLRAPDERES